MQRACLPEIKEDISLGGGMPEADLSSWDVLIQTLLLMGDMCHWQATPQTKIISSSCL